VFQHVGATIDHGLEQCRKHAHAVLQAAVRIDPFHDVVEGRQGRKPHRHQHARADDEAGIGDLGFVVRIEPHRRRAQIRRS
jgi:hypothetical protein